MRIKKGFTLAEILIVLMVIGALATMTIPSLMKGVTEAQWKTAYRKAFNAIVNLTTMEKLSGNLPARATVANANRLFDTLASSLSVKGYVNATAAKGDGTIVADADSYKTSINDTALNTQQRHLNWIVTDDNIAYLVRLGSKDASKNCGTKIAITDNQKDQKQATQLTDLSATTAVTDKMDGEACFVIYVDTNGLGAGPNTTITNYVAKDARMGAITDDIFPIYVGIDGATAGSQATTYTGRIVSDLK